MTAATQTSEITEIDQAKIACDGGSTAGHPRVFLTVGKNGSVDCPYCGKRFVLKDGARPAAH